MPLSLMYLNTLTSGVSSCMMRPTENPNSFYIALGGAIDYAKIVADKEEYIKAVRAATGRHDLQIGHLRWVTDWR